MSRAGGRVKALPPSPRHAARLGFKDGLAEPLELGMGMTWADDDALNDAYDRGVNAGQIVGWLIRPALWKDRPQPWQGDAR